MTPYWIFIIFFLTFGLTNSVFAEPEDVDIDWIIEGQSIISKSEISELETENSSIIDEQIDNFLSNDEPINYNVSEDFITGSKYMIAGRVITIESKEGQILNQLLIRTKRHQQR